MLALMLSVHTPQALDPALGPALQELLAMCRACVQQRSALEQEAKERKAKGSGRRIGQIIVKFLLCFFYYIFIAFSHPTDNGFIKKRPLDGPVFLFY